MPNHHVRALSTVCCVGTVRFKQERGRQKRGLRVLASRDSLHVILVFNPPMVPNRAFIPFQKRQFGSHDANSSPHQSHDREESCTRRDLPQGAFGSDPTTMILMVSKGCLAANMVRAMPVVAVAGATLGGYPSVLRERTNGMQRAADVAPT
jgi:hypothetical protein